MIRKTNQKIIPDNKKIPLFWAGAVLQLFVKIPLVVGAVFWLFFSFLLF